MALFEVKDIDRQIYEEEIRDFLPDEIIDIHTHIWLQQLRQPLEGDGGVIWPNLVAKDNSVEDLQETYRLMFPGKKVTPLIFATTSSDMEKMNEYVKGSVAKTGYPALYFSSPGESGEEVERRIREGGYLGLKSYLSLSPKYLPRNEVRVFDFFTKAQLKKLNEMKGIVMLHLPRNGRLKDPVNLAQIKELKQEFPDVRLIVAHIGRAYVQNDIGNAFEELAECSDLLFDFCANSCEYAMIKALEAVGPKRLMFGSDMPILRMRSRRIEENNMYINLVPPGMYGDPAQDKHLREVSEEEAKKITFFMYEEILAFKRAAMKMGLSKEDIKDVFYRNAKNLIDDTRRDIYGI